MHIPLLMIIRLNNQPATCACIFVPLVYECQPIASDSRGPVVQSIISIALLDEDSVSLIILTKFIAVIFLLTDCKELLHSHFSTKNAYCIICLKF